MDKPPGNVLIERRPSRFPLWWAVGANGLVFLLTIQFYWVPRGLPIRPMGWAYWVFMIAIGGLAVIPLALPALWRCRRLAWAWFAVALALTPLPLATAMLHHAESVRGFILEP